MSPTATHQGPATHDTNERTPTVAGGGVALVMTDQAAVFDRMVVVGGADEPELEQLARERLTPITRKLEREALQDERDRCGTPRSGARPMGTPCRLVPPRGGFDGVVQ
jgi:hypothetical protein